MNAARDLVLGQPVGWGVVASIAWSLGILAVFGPAGRAALPPGGLTSACAARPAGPSSRLTARPAPSQGGHP